MARDKMKTNDDCNAVIAAKNLQIRMTQILNHLLLDEILGRFDSMHRRHRFNLIIHD